MRFLVFPNIVDFLFLLSLVVWPLGVVARFRVRTYEEARQDAVFARKRAEPVSERQVHCFYEPGGVGVSLVSTHRFVSSLYWN